MQSYFALARSFSDIDMAANWSNEETRMYDSRETAWRSFTGLIAANRLFVGDLVFKCLGGILVAGSDWPEVFCAAR